MRIGWRFLPVFLLLAPSIAAEKFYGCAYEAELCGEDEVCAEDGLFGRCLVEGAELSVPTIIRQLGQDELIVLKAQLATLVDQGRTWESARVQCEVAYFFLAHNHELPYQADFCDVRAPVNVLAVVQLVEEGLEEAETEAAIAALQEIPLETEQSTEEEAPVDYAVSPIEAIDYEGGEVEKRAEPLEEDVDRNAVLHNLVQQLLANIDEQEEEAAEYEGPSPVAEYEVEYPMEEEPVEYAMPAYDQVQEPPIGQLTEDDQGTLNELLMTVMQGGAPDLSQLSDDQLNNFILNIQIMQDILRNTPVEDEVSGSKEELIPELERSEDPNAERFMLKKDEEELGDLSMGLPAEHRIVKGNGVEEPEHLHRIQGNTVYIRLNKDMERDEGKVLDLITFLEQNIARPKNLTFHNFHVDGNEVSFEVRDGGDDWSSDLFSPRFSQEMGKQEKRLIPVSEVAEAVYKRKADIPSSIGEVEETGLGSGEDSVAVERAGSDRGLVPLTLGVCGLVVGVLTSLLSVYVYRNRSQAKAGIQRLAHDLEGAPQKAYEELCRQRMAAKGAETAGSPPANAGGRNSSTSSWSEEPVPTTNMDISTGHIILSYLEEHLVKKERLAEEWEGLGTGSDGLDSTIARLPENVEKNLDLAIVPYDLVRVKLESGASDYINASPIYDSDPSTAVYIAAQGPLPETTTAFWQMVWEQGAVLVLNLAPTGPHGHKYWPSNGSDLYGIFEVHLVSEHIWCEDYVVRSFYLKNTRTSETRTVTQFHFLSWPDTHPPSNPKPLLEFRRKVNKSYRGRGGSPIVVHCTDGSGRTGTYCLLDMVLNRVNQGVKEMNMAGTLEHLRDQRAGMVGDVEQYRFALSCVAAEVAATLAALPTH